MVLESHMKFCVTAGFPWKKKDCPNNLENGPKIGNNRVLWIYWKILSLNFTEFVLWIRFVLFAVFLHKSNIWEKKFSWDMGQNVLSDCRISRTNQCNSVIFCMLIQIHIN